jgi:hypothetical protein
MNSLQVNQNFAGAAAQVAIHAILPLQDGSAKAAQVIPTQQLLFPFSPRAICDEIGLNWWAALKLYEDGWLSFSPEGTPRLDERQEAELRFVGSLVLAGCDRTMLTSLLSSLPKPYAYHASRLYYDWAARHWRLLPDPRANREAQFADWLDALVDNQDVGSLTGIVELAHDALTRLRVVSAQPELRGQA